MPLKKENSAAFRYFLSIFTVDECKTRWRTIRESYEKITKKTAGSAAPVKSKYNRDNLKCLDSCLQDRRSFVMQIRFLSVFGENVNDFNELCCFRSRCTIDKDETQLSTSNNDSFDHGSINEEGQRNTNNEDVEEVVECDDVSSSLKEHESRDDCSLRQNLQNKSNRSEGSEKKRRKVVSQKEKLLADIFRGHEERLQILKRMAEKTDAESHNLVFTFFKSMAQTVTQFPPSIIAETRVKICQLVAQLEAKALHEQNQARASGFPFHNFSFSFDYQVPCYSCHGNVPPAPCHSSAQMLSSASPTTDSCSRVSHSDPTPTPTPPQNGKEGKSSANDEFDPYTSSFADEFK